MSRAAASISVSFHVLSCRRPLFLVRALTPPGLRGSQPVVKVQLHSAGDASPLHPTAHSPRRGGPGLTALLLHQIFPIFSVVAPLRRGPHGADFAPWGGSAGRLAALGATLDFHRGLPAGAVNRSRHWCV